MITPVNSVKFNRIPQNYSNFLSIYQLKQTAQNDISFQGISTHKINPLYNFLISLFNRSIVASRKRFAPILNGLEGKVNDVTIPTKDKKFLHGWDIKASNSDKYIMYFHGASQNITNNQIIYKKFIDNNYNVLAGEYRSFGKNKPCKSDETTIEKDVEAMQNYLIKQGVKPENIGIIGHSLGAYAAMLAAEKNPKSSFLILLSPINSLAYEADNFLKKSRIKIPKTLEKLIKRYPKILNLLSNMFKTESRVGKLNTPTYIIHSANDKLVPIKSSEHLANKSKNLGGLIVLKTGGHTLESSKIEVVDKLLKKFINN